jgi:hypothetical protein
MGGWMSYQRMRSRNGLMYRKPDDDRDPYWRGRLADVAPMHAGESDREKSRIEMLVGDINRMERDYLGGPHAGAGIGSRDVNVTGESLSDEVAAHTGVDIETVKKVLRYVFLEQA